MRHMGWVSSFLRSLVPWFLLVSSLPPLIHSVRSVSLTHSARSLTFTLLMN